MIDPGYIKHVNSITIPELKEMLRVMSDEKYPEHKELIQERIKELKNNAEADNSSTSELEYNLNLNEEIKSEYTGENSSVREKMLKSKTPKTINYLKFWVIFQIVILPILAFVLYKDTFRYFHNSIFLGKLYYSLDILMIVVYIYISILILRIIKVRTAETFLKLKSYLLIILVLNIANILLENFILNGFDLILLWDSILEQRGILFSLSFYLSFVYNKSIETYYSHPDIILFDKGLFKW